MVGIKKHYGGILMTESLKPQNIRPQTYIEYRDVWKKAESLNVLTGFPLHLDIELTNVCNLKCKMCWQNDLLNSEKGFMSEELFKRIIDEGIENGLSAIKLQIRGESTLHPDLISFIKYAKAAGIFDIQLTTNGILLASDEKLVDILQSGLDKLIISIDDNHNESAKQIYGDNAPEITFVVKNAVKVKKRLLSTSPLIRVQRTFDVNSETSDQCLEKLKASFPDVDEYNVNPVFNFKDDEDCVEGLKDRYELLPCTYLWTRLAIYWNGLVSPCCKDYNAKFDLGNINTNSIKDIWLGEKMMQLREKHLNNKRKEVPICQHCNYCIKNKNKSEVLGIIEKNNQAVI